MRNRLAFTLAELLVVMTASSLILTTSAAVIHRVMHAQSKTQQFYRIERNALRLSKQFRRDVNQAISASVEEKVPNSGVFLLLELPNDRQIKYIRSGEALRRIVSHDETAFAQEEFVFTPAVQVSIQETHAPERLILSLTTSPESKTSESGAVKGDAYDIPVSVQTEAVLGRQNSRYRPSSPSESVK